MAKSNVTGTASWVDGEDTFDHAYPDPIGKKGLEVKQAAANDPLQDGYTRAVMVHNQASEFDSTTDEYDRYKMHRENVDIERVR